jgi:cellulose synthase/poly-beta-1,6-N-acetylglucosamine synthase-like glycosyltransferase
MTVGFWVCIAWLAYVYVGYPLLVLLLGQLVRRHVVRGDSTPAVCVVIAAFNEATEIERTVENKLMQDYAPDRLSVVVVSDCSTDATEDRVGALAAAHPHRVTLLRQEPRQGKTAALNRALRETSTDIVVFADANSMYAPDAISKLVRCFDDPTIGYVTGQMIYTHAGTTGVGEGSGRYMSYENVLRALETRLGSIVGVDGGVDAIRRALYRPMHPDQLPDFVLPLDVVEQGMRVVYEPEALLYEPALTDARSEFRMRVRVSLRALWAMYDKRRLLNPFRYPVFAWQLFSHKVLRYSAFVPLVGLVICNLALLGEGAFYLVFMFLQAAAYAAAALGHLSRRVLTRVPGLLAPYYFVLLNAACMIAAWKFIRRQKIVVWTPRVGT